MDPAQQPACDARRAARPPGDLQRARLARRHAEQPGGARHDQRQFFRFVEFEPQRNAEALAQRRGQQAGARRGADQGKGRQVDAHRARGRPLADHQVELAVLQRRVEDFLDRRVQAVDFVDEQHVARLEVGQQGREVAGAQDDRPGGRAETDAQFAGDDLRQRRLAEARRPDEQHMVERFAARPGGVYEDPEVAPEALLADEFLECSGAQRRIAVSRAVFRRHGPLRSHRTSSLRLARTRSSKAAVSPRLRLAAAAAASASERP